MRDTLVYHVASGQAFFSGVLLLVLSAVFVYPRARLVLSLVRGLGVALIVASATPLPLAFYALAITVTCAWGLGEGTAWARKGRRRLGLRVSVVVVWSLGVLLELPYHIAPGIPRVASRSLDLIGDSLSAGLGGESITWPGLLARSNRVVVRSHAIAGATIASAFRTQAPRAHDPKALVLVELGGNDILGGTPYADFERGLDALLTRLRSQGATVVMLELPLRPFDNRYGAIQRRLARRHSVYLIPKRVLLAPLTTKGCTVDDIHLSDLGHALMAKNVWKAIRGAF